MNNTQDLEIRAMCDDDPPVIAVAFAQMGWNKPEARYRQYLDEQSAGTRTCLVAIVDGQFAGYVTVNWRPSYRGFSEEHIPEIQDLNILRQFRRQGIASRLLDHAESEVAQHSSIVGIGVGLHPGYNVAQRLYVRRGYVPDGRGVIYRDRYIHEGEPVVLDDELLLHFTKLLRGE
jgi:GNAT superfamily N-acetyltransferase